MRDAVLDAATAAALAAAAAAAAAAAVAAVAGDGLDAFVVDELRSVNEVTPNMSGDPRPDD